MRLYEYQGMELFRKYHIPVAPGFLITNLKELKNKNPNRSKPRGIFNLNWELIMPQQAAGYYTQLRNKFFILFFILQIFNIKIQAQ